MRESLDAVQALADIDWPRALLETTLMSPEWLTAFAAVLWPVIVIVAVIVLGRMLLRELRSGREIRIKVGDYEISLGEVQRQQSRLLQDLTWSIVSLRASVRGDAKAVVGRPRSLADKSLLWVDDRPENNAVLIDELKGLGTLVVTARSTDEARAMLGRRGYDFIVTDMKRGDADEAGLELLQLVRAEGGPHQATPVFVFCSDWGARHYKDAVTEAGGTGTTASGTELLALLADAV
jgi:CheY-like chemotaxis protein